MAENSMPDRLWLGCADADNEHQVWFDPGEGGTEYVRADSAHARGKQEPVAWMWEAFEEAAKMVEFAWVRPPPIAYRLAAAIRAKAEGGNRT